MNQPSHRSPPQDDVDAIVDTLLENPSCAEDVKSELRARLKEASAPKLATVTRLKPAAADEIDDMWDNVPV